MNLDVLPELEELWERHLNRIDFPVRTDLDEQAAIRRFGVEGRVKMLTHKRRERDGALARQKKTEALRLYGKLECEVCTFIFTGKYGDHGSEFIECHHREPLATLDPSDGKQITLEDLALVCANCHRMLHWKDFPSIASFSAPVVNTRRELEFREIEPQQPSNPTVEDFDSRHQRRPGRRQVRSERA